MTDETETLTQVEARLDAEDKAIAAGDKAPEGDMLAAQEADAKAKAEAKQAADKASADEADAKAAAEAKAKEEANPEPTLPLNRHKAILNSERSAREAAETRADELEQRLASLEAKKPDPKQRAAVLAKLKEDFPEEMVGVITGLQAEIDELREQATDRVAASQRAVADEIQDVVDSDPDLAKWQDEALKEGATAADRERWDAAVAYDKTLKASKAWAGKPMAERFARAAELVCDDFGLDRTKPATAKPAPSAAPTTKPLPARGAAAPTTLSDVPGGVPPITDRLEAFQRTDPLSAAAAAQRMTDAQFEQYMAGMGQ